MVNTITLKNPLVRGVWYLLALCLLIPVTAMILTAMFTNNWQRSTGSLNTSYQSVSFGIWFQCRHVTVAWLNNQQDSFCSSIDFNLYSWIIAVQVFYTIAALLNIVCSLVSMFGLCHELTENKLAIPSFLMWTLAISSCSQVIAISIYGGRGIADYSSFVPDYSIIIASVALPLNVICSVLYFVEILFKSKEMNQ